MNGLTQGYFGGLGYGSFEGYKMLLKTEFEKKIHALYFLKREKDFKPIHLAVNPVSFIILDSRSIFKDSNEVLRTHHSRISSLLIWIFIGQIIYFGPIIAALIWSLLVLAQSSMMISILIISWLVSALALAIPFYRVYKVLIRKRGWPRECFLYDSPSGILV